MLEEVSGSSLQDPFRSLPLVSNKAGVFGESRYLLNFNPKICNNSLHPENSLLNGGLSFFGLSRVLFSHRKTLEACTLNKDRPRPIISLSIAYGATGNQQVVSHIVKLSGS